MEPERTLVKEKTRALSILSHLVLPKENHEALKQVVSLDTLRAMKNTNHQQVSLILSKLESKPLATASMGEKHVMISYSWKNQPEILRVREYLAEKPVPVWIDLESLKGNVVDGIVTGIQGAACVLIFISESNMKSAICRFEAEYAIVSLKKPVTFVLMEKDYKPEGWLAFLMGSSLYIDLTSERKWVEGLEKIVSNAFSHLPATLPLVAASPTPRIAVDAVKPFPPGENAPAKKTEDIVILRRYGSFGGGKVIRFPATMVDLLQELQGLWN